MSTNRFTVNLELEIVIDLDDEVTTRVNDEWRRDFYNLHKPEEIAEHIARNIVINHWPLSHLDGWADLPDNMAKVISWETL